MNNCLTSKQKGNLTELQCITAFYELGYPVSIPYGENSRYDFIADIDGYLIKVQVKTAHLSEDGKSFEFSCRSTRTNSQGSISRKYTKNEIDYFSTFCKNQCYLIPVEECSRSKCLRLEPLDKNQRVGINMAKNYELLTQIKKIK